MNKISIILIVIISLFLLSCSPLSNGTETLFYTVADGLENCEFKNIIPLLSSKIQDEPFGFPYSSLERDLKKNFLNDCISGCSTLENRLIPYGYNCNTFCNVDLNSKEITLELECILRRITDGDGYTASYELINSERISESKVKFNVLMKMPEFPDTEHNFDMEFIKEDNQWRLNTPMGYY